MSISRVATQDFYFNYMDEAITLNRGAEPEPELELELDLDKEILKPKGTVFEGGDTYVGDGVGAGVIWGPAGQGRDSYNGTNVGQGDAGRVVPRAGERRPRLTGSAKRVAQDGVSGRAKGFLAAVPSAFSYPFQSSGWMMLVGGSVVYWGIDYLSQVAGPFGYPIAAIMSAYLSAFLLRIVMHSGHGEDEVPDWPDFFSAADFVYPGFLFALPVLLSIGPAALMSLVGLPPAAVLASLFIGSFCLPMMILSVAMFNNPFALSPAVVIPSIVRSFRSYLVAVPVLAALVLLRAVKAGMLPVALPEIPYVGGLLGQFASLYLVIVTMRVLGLLYRHNASELGWDC